MQSPEEELHVGDAMAGTSFVARKKDEAARVPDV